MKEPLPPPSATDQLLIAALVLPLIIASLFCNIRMIFIGLATFQQEKKHPYYPYLAAIQALSMLISLLLLSIFVTFVVFGIAFDEHKPSFLYIAIPAEIAYCIPSELLLLDILLCLQRNLIFFFGVRRFQNFHRFAIMCIIVFTGPLCTLAFYSLIFTLDDSKNPSSKYYTPAVFEADVAIRLSCSLFATCSYSMILYSLRRSTRNSVVCRGNDYMIVLQVLPITFYQLLSSSVHLFFYLFPAPASYSPAAMLIAVTIIYSIVVPLSIALGNSNKRQMFFSRQSFRFNLKSEPVSVQQIISLANIE